MDEGKNAADASELEQRLDGELDRFIESLPRRTYEDGLSEANWETEMQQHPLFRTEAIQEGEELPPLVEAFQMLKYDEEENSPEELANGYKEDGNHNFKMKRYKMAIKAYTEGIKQKCSNKELNAQLLTNRAAANYHLGNLRSSLQDCIMALKFKEDHLKAIIRGAQCNLELKDFAEAIIWCDRGLSLGAMGTALKNLKDKALTQQKIAERDARRHAALARKEKVKEDSLFMAIQQRCIRLARKVETDYNMDVSTSLSRDSTLVQPSHPLATGTRVHLNEEDSLIWPVVFNYPEYGISDIVKDFHEDVTFKDQLHEMFPSEDGHAPWDEKMKYVSGNLAVYFKEFEGSEVSAIHEIDVNSTLRNVLSNSSYRVYDGTPMFDIVAKHSPFQHHLLKGY